MRRALLSLALVLSTVGCNSSVEPGNSESWAADIASTRQVLFMTIRIRDSEVTGTGSLSSLTNPGGDALTITGTRRADSLLVTFQRQRVDPFHFTGRYVGAGLSGVLDGAEFVQLSVSFRSP